MHPKSWQQPVDAARAADMAINAYIAHGEFAIGMADADVLSATLGSCVSVCLWDEKARVGGMNHILLPGSRDADQKRFGSADMERLINALIRSGASRDRMKAKVFGGASMLDGQSDIGDQNASFALGFLQREGIPIVAKSTGGNQARQVRFFPTTGNVKHRFIAKESVEPPQPIKVVQNDVELF